MVSGRNIARAQKGFTMMELLGVVAIMVVLFAVAFPAFTSIQTNMRMMELNAKAQQVYDAAQNRLSAMQSNGALVDTEGPLSIVSNKISEAPASFTGTTGGWQSDSWDDYGVYHYAETEEAVTKYLITDETSLGLQGNVSGHYIIELSPSTGEVYAVYYWEDKDAQNGGNLSYDDVKNLTASSATMRVGYYGGKPVDERIEHSGHILLNDLQCTIVNDEELYLKFTCPDFSKLLFDTSKVELTFKIGDKSYTLHKDDLAIDAQTDEIDFLLDSMRANMNFGTITAGSNVTPGSNFTVMDITFSYDGMSVPLGDRTQNSLFGYDSANTDSSTVLVSTLRHLNNLRAVTAEQSAAGSTGTVRTDIANVKQTADIDFAVWDTTKVSLVSRTLTTNPLGATFTPITVDSALAGTYTGAHTVGESTDSYALKHFTVAPADDGTGIFSSIPFSADHLIVSDFATSATAGNYTGALAGRATAGSIDNVLVSNPTIAGGDYYTGGLVGSFDGTSVKNVSIVNPHIEAGGVAGGMIGWLASGTVDDSSVYLDGADATKTYGIVGTGALGGLIGTSESSGAIINCFAAVDVTSTLTGDADVSNTAGFIGEATGTGGISNCYSSGDAIGKSGVGGFVAFLSSTKGDIADCYTTSNVSGSSYVGGFLGVTRYNSISYTNDVSYGLVSGSIPTYVGGFVGYISKGNKFDANCAYLTAKGYNDSFSTTVAQPAAATYDGLVSRVTDASRLDVAHSHPYASYLNGTAYPFACTVSGNMQSAQHYGNWPAYAVVTWKRGNSTSVDEQYLYGATPTKPNMVPDYEAKGTRSDGTKVNVLMLWDGTWDKPLAPVTGAVTYTAHYDTSVAYPSMSYLLEDGTAYAKSGAKTSLLVWSQYLGDKSDATSKYASDTKSIDSEGTYGPAFKNATTTMRNYLYKLGFYSITSATTTPIPESAGNFNYSWRYYVLNGTYAQLNGLKNGLLRNNQSDYDGNLTIMLGQKIDPNETGTLQVLIYDAGHASSGNEPAYIHATVKITNVNPIKKPNKLDYYVYDPDTIVYTSEWGNLG